MEKCSGLKAEEREGEAEIAATEVTVVAVATVIARQTLKLTKRILISIPMITVVPFR